MSPEHNFNKSLYFTVPCRILQHTFTLQNKNFRIHQNVFQTDLKAELFCCNLVILPFNLNIHQNEKCVLQCTQSEKLCFEICTQRH